MSDYAEQRPQVAPDRCLQCEETKAAVRANRLFCCTVSRGEVTEVDEEWERHRWADWSHLELVRAGIRPEAVDLHRRTSAPTLQWVPCEDTRYGHQPADEEATAAWGVPAGVCVHCGRREGGEPS